MKYEVIRRFRDKYTGKIILPGSTFICDESDRIKNLISKGFIKKMGYDYNSLTKKELMQLLEEKYIEFNDRQTKLELIELLGGD